MIIIGNELSKKLISLDEDKKSSYTKQLLTIILNEFGINNGFQNILKAMNDEPSLSALQSFTTFIKHILPLCS